MATKVGVHPSATQNAGKGAYQPFSLARTGWPCVGKGCGALQSFFQLRVLWSHASLVVCRSLSIRSASAYHTKIEIAYWSCKASGLQSSRSSFTLVSYRERSLETTIQFPGMEREQ